MALTGSVFLDLILVLTVGAFVAVVVIWPYLGLQRAHHVAARAGLLITINVLVLATAASQLNAQYLFYTSWGDLLGGGHTSATALSRGAGAAQAAGQKVKGIAAQVGPMLPPPPPSAASVHTYMVAGKLSGLVGQVTVELPTGYSALPNRTVRYPVLETFGGYPGSPGQWIRSLRLGGVIQQEMSLGQIGPVLIVSPEVQIPVGTDTECVNGGAGRPQLETWIAEDVPNWIAHTFRVSAARSSWATIGFSAGAWCAAMATMLHPAQYAAAVVMGGYFHPDFSPDYEPFTPQSDLAKHYDLVALAQHHPPPVAIWMETSHADPLSYSSSARMIRAARAPTAIAATVLKDAGHRMSVWRGELPSVVRWLGANIPGFAPAGLQAEDS